jgi:hypothetical protein
MISANEAYRIYQNAKEEATLVSKAEHWMESALAPEIELIAKNEWTCFEYLCPTELTNIVLSKLRDLGYYASDSGPVNPCTLLNKHKIFISWEIKNQ